MGDQAQRLATFRQGAPEWFAGALRIGKSAEWMKHASDEQYAGQVAGVKSDA